MRKAVKVGDRVYVKSPGFPAHWRFGRVVEWHPGSGGLVLPDGHDYAFGWAPREVQPVPTVWENAKALLSWVWRRFGRRL